jgi:hypothetical protein
LLPAIDGRDEREQKLPAFSDEMVNRYRGTGRLMARGASHHLPVVTRLAGL